jgi:hypothetical protein
MISFTRFSGPRSVSTSIRPPMMARRVPRIIARTETLAERSLSSLPISCAWLTNWRSDAIALESMSADCTRAVFQSAAACSMPAEPAVSDRASGLILDTRSCIVGLPSPSFEIVCTTFVNTFRSARTTSRDVPSRALSIWLV